jgi:3D (Asp-Asp-Asp) domain-containing protein
MALDAPAIQDLLRRLGYYAGPSDANLTSPATRRAVTSFQKWTGLQADGVIGKKQTLPALERYATLLAAAPAGLGVCRSWRFTQYYLADEKLYGGPATVPIYDRKKKVIDTTTPHFFAKVSLEGSGLLDDGRLINVDGTVTVDAGLFAQVLLLARARGWIPQKAGYAGLTVAGARGAEHVVKARAFAVVGEARKGVGYGSVAGRAHVPFRTLATDNGSLPAHDPRFRGKGGAIPRGTRCWIAEWAGVALPDGSVHDGWFDAVDTGGGIDGNQCDVFTGTSELSKRVLVPGHGHLWYEGIDQRLPRGYAFGS